MKIINIMLLEGFGGIEQAFLSYNEALKFTGHEVVSIISKNAKVSDLISGKSYSVKARGRNDIFALIKLKAIILKEKPDIIIAHTTSDTSIARKIAGKKPVISVSHGHNFKHLVGKQYIIAITNFMKKAIINLGHPENMISHIPNMTQINDEFINPKPSETLTFGFLGRLETIKACDVLLKAAFLLKSKGYKFNIIIAGDGSERSKLEEFVDQNGLNSHVKFLGWLDVDKKSNFFKSIDVYCLPSNGETFSISLIEAMAHSKPCISTETIGPKEIDGNKNAVLFSRVSDPADFAASMEKLILKPKLLASYAKKSYEIAQKYSVKEVSRLINDLLTQVKG